MDISIVIPCYNEAANVGLLAETLLPVVTDLRRDRSVEIVFVDDGSTDGTSDLLQRRFGSDPHTRAIRHAYNRGLGAALRTGFSHATGQIVVTTDSDSTYPYVLIPLLLERLGPGVDIVTGSCYHPAGGVANVPGYRVFLSKTASLMYRVILRWEIHTYTCMFRAYRRDVIQAVPFRANGFLSVTELLANALGRGYVVEELPCVLQVRRYGASKAKIARIVLSHLRFQWHLLRSKRLPHEAQLPLAGQAPVADSAGT